MINPKMRDTNVHATDTHVEILYLRNATDWCIRHYRQLNLQRGGFFGKSSVKVSRSKLNCFPGTAADTNGHSVMTAQGSEFLTKTAILGSQVLINLIKQRCGYKWRQIRNAHVVARVVIVLIRLLSLIFESKKKKREGEKDKKQVGKGYK